ncbi:MAG: hypothetical protein AAGJ97_12485, partial [Planctomycetota bacterium]
MAFRIQLQADPPAGDYIDFDLTAQRVALETIEFSYDGPARLAFVVHQPSQTVPLPFRGFLRVWDDSGTNPRTGQIFTADDPLWEGHVVDADPGSGANEVRYVALDPTSAASTDARVMSLPWDAPAVSGDRPTPATGATPRLVFNGDNITNDPDAAYSRTNDADVGYMISVLLNDQQELLEYHNAAPTGSAAFVTTGELDSIDYVPQEKLVFDSMPLRAAIGKLLAYEPEWRMLWYPGTRQWRFGKVRQSPKVTLTLNDATAPHPILDADLDRSLDDRHTAVRFMGPERVENTTATFSANELTRDVNGDGSVTFQITDADKRRMANLLRSTISVDGYRFTRRTSELIETLAVGLRRTRRPVFQIRYEETTSGDGLWRTVGGWRADRLAGTVTFPDDSRLKRAKYPPPLPGAGSPADPNARYELPVDYRFTYGAFVDPFQVRYPETGHEGTTYDRYGHESELLVYDEMLRVWAGTNEDVTTSLRLQRFEELARRLHATKSDEEVVGSVVL